MDSDEEEDYIRHAEGWGSDADSRGFASVPVRRAIATRSHAAGHGSNGSHDLSDARDDASGERGAGGTIGGSPAREPRTPAERFYDSELDGGSGAVYVLLRSKGRDPLLD